MIDRVAVMSSPEVDFRFCPRCGGSLDRRQLKGTEPERLVCRLCDFVLFEDPKVAAGTLFQLEGGLVLLKRAIEPGYGKWVFPGGFVDRGETVMEAAIRETREEANVDVKIRELVDVFSYSGSPVVVIVYAAEVVSGEPRAADESLELRAFDPAEIPWGELAFSSTRDALREYVRRFLCPRRAETRGPGGPRS
jgi:ADP-ribose pyrophosphatase YjhB (NUDIX family)